MPASLQESVVIPDSNTWAVQLAVGTEGFTSSDVEISSLYFVKTQPLSADVCGWVSAEIHK